MTLDFLDDGKRVVTATFGVTLYTRTELPKVKLAACFERYAALSPKLTVYRTGPTFRPIAKTTKIGTSIKPDRARHVVVDARDVGHPEAPRFKFLAHGYEKSAYEHKHKAAGYLRLVVPFEWGESKADELRALVYDLCSLFPFTSGHAGYALEVGQGASFGGAKHAHAMSMQHRGVDVFFDDKDGRAVAADGLKGVGWLTVLGNHFVDELGGVKTLRKQLPKSIALDIVEGGIAVRAGERPAIDDVALYEEVHAVIAPFVERTIGRYGSTSFMSSPRTAEWLRRLERAAPLPPAELLAQIREHPDDDGPRLAYADWLADRDRVLGELVVLQCQIASTSDNKKRGALQRREEALLAANPRLLRTPTPLFEATRRRGLIEAARVYPHHWTELASNLDAILRVVPMLREVRVNEDEAAPLRAVLEKRGIVVGS